MPSTEYKFIQVGESDEFIEYTEQSWAESRPTQQLARKTMPTPRAEFAMNLLIHNGIITARDGGEDSSGRAKLRQETPRELVDRAVEIAELAFSAFAQRGWLHQTTDLQEAMRLMEVARQVSDRTAKCRSSN